MPMRFYWLVLGILGVWRIVHLLNAEDGPWNLMTNLRRVAGAGLWGELLDCFYCLSLWVAAPFAYGLGERWTEKFLLWPALSGAAILAERLTFRADQFHPALYTEDKEAEDVLRKQQVAVSGNDGQSTPV
jgi:Protein of unknown function (DUF1360)